jgi:hypothetical protein
MNAFIHFAEELLEAASKGKKSDKDYLAVFKKGIAALRAVRDYNESLIRLQGLDMADVIRHSKDIILEKRKPIRGAKV